MAIHTWYTYGHRYNVNGKFCLVGRRRRYSRTVGVLSDQWLVGSSCINGADRPTDLHFRPTMHAVGIWCSIPVSGASWAPHGVWGELSAANDFRAFREQFCAIFTHLLVQLDLTAAWKWDIHTSQWSHPFTAGVGKLFGVEGGMSPKELAAGRTGKFYV